MWHRSVKTMPMLLSQARKFVCKYSEERVRRQRFKAKKGNSKCTQCSFTTKKKIYTFLMSRNQKAFGKYSSPFQDTANRFPWLFLHSNKLISENKLSISWEEIISLLRTLSDTRMWRIPVVWSCLLFLWRVYMKRYRNPRPEDLKRGDGLLCFFKKCDRKSAWGLNFFFFSWWGQSQFSTVRKVLWGKLAFTTA